MADGQENRLPQKRETQGVRRVEPESKAPPGKPPQEKSGGRKIRTVRFQKQVPDGQGDSLDSYSPDARASQEQPLRRTRPVGDAGADDGRDFSGWDGPGAQGASGGKAQDLDAGRSSEMRDAGKKDSRAGADRKKNAARAKGKSERAQAEVLDKASDAAIKSGDGEAMAAGVAGKTIAGAAKGGSEAKERNKLKQIDNERELEDEMARSAGTDDVAGSAMRQDDLRDKQDQLKRDGIKETAGGAVKGAAKGFKDGVEEAATAGASGTGGQAGVGIPNAQAGAANGAVSGADAAGAAKKKPSDDGPVDAEAWDRENEKSDRDKDDKSQDKDKDDEDKDKDKDKDKDGEGKDKDGEGGKGKDKDGKKGGLMDKLTGGDKKGFAKVKDIAHKAAMAAKAGITLLKNLIIMSFLNYMAGILSAIATAATNLLMSIVNAVIGFIANVANAIGASFTAVATIFAIIGSVVVGGGAVGVVAYNAATTAMRDDPIREECVVVGTLGADSAFGDEDALMLANAKIVWSVYSHYGNSEAVAGILGNWQIESKVDATAVEHIYSEPFTVGMMKSACWKNYNFNFYDIAQAYPVMKEYYDGYPYGSSPPTVLGIGMGQWTNDRATKLLSYAESAGMNWYDIVLQLAYSLDPAGDGSDAYIMKTYLGIVHSNPSDAAEWFRSNWERGGAGSSDDRKANAEAWMGQISLWASEDADTGYYDSVLSLIGNVMVEGDGVGVSSASKKCTGAVIAENERLAYAGALIAYMTDAKADAMYAPNGVSPGAATINTPKGVYKSVHEAVIPGDTWFASCDRCVCTSVRWSGTDDNFPEGVCSTILTYMEKGNGRFNGTCGWVNVTDLYTNENAAEVPAGAVLVYANTTGQGHIVLHTGTTIMNNVYGGKSGFDTNSSISSASYNQRQAGCGPWWNDLGLGSSSEIYWGGSDYRSDHYQIYVWSGPLNWGEESKYADAGGFGTVEYIFSHKDDPSIVGDDFYT